MLHGSVSLPPFGLARPKQRGTWEDKSGEKSLRMVLGGRDRSLSWTLAIGSRSTSRW